MRKAAWIVSVFAIGLLMALGCATPAHHEITISAAASLTEPLKDIAKAFHTAHPDQELKTNFGASGALVKQIEQGAPVDVFLSAGSEEMDSLSKSNHLYEDSRITFATNQLVLVVPRDSKLSGWTDLKSGVIKKFAIANPETTPSGRYGKSTLVHRGVWEFVSKKLVLCQNVRQTLNYVAAGDVEAGIVFASDAKSDPVHVRTIAVAQSGLDHPKILYQGAVMSKSHHREDANTFISFIKGAEAQAILAKFGFGHAPDSR